MNPTIIIGAGPAGLAVAGSLRKANLPFLILEKSDKIASAWHGHYDRLHLHTVKQYSALPYLPFPAHYPTYVSRLDLIAYYENYAKTFDIEPVFKTEVSAIQRIDKHQIKITTKKGEIFESENVVIATGINRVPHMPTWKGMEDYKGKLLHSRFYKNTEPYKGQKVLIIGMGNTGAEVALDLSENDIETYISVRSPLCIVPRDVNGRPVQVTAKVLEKFPFGMGDWLGTQIRKRIIGDLSAYGIQTLFTPPAQLLRETGQTPIIDLGTVAHIKSGKIKVLPDIASFYKHGVILQNGEQHRFDSIIMATGYRAQLSDFLEDTSLFDANYLPKSPIGTGKQAGLFFVGFDNYKLGGILGTILTDSELIIKDIVLKKA